MKMRILITGANGLLGQDLSFLLAEKHEVYALVRRLPDRQHPRINYCLCDLSKRFDSDILPRNVDIIYHLAQSDFYRDFPQNALDIFNVNIASTAFLLDFAYKNRVRHFVFASSGGVYAQSEAPIEEGGTITSFEKMGYYISSKFSGELLAQSYSKEFKVDIPRFFFIYGPRQKRSMLIPRIVDSVRDGKIIKLDGKDGLMVNPIYVRDASYALEQMIKYEGEGRVYNVGGPEILSIRKIAEIAALSQSREPKFEIAEGGGLHLISNNSLMESNLCVPKYRFEEEIKSIIVQGASQ